jgi:hypothetical protein
MINTFKIGPFHTVRVWADELPEIRFRERPSAALALNATDETAIEPRTAAIEFRKFVGPRAIYGLLAAKCEPARRGETGWLAVSGAEPLDADHISWALGGSTDPVTPGVYPEFAAAILQGASNVMKLQDIGKLNIQFFGAD